MSGASYNGDVVVRLPPRPLADKMIELFSFLPRDHIRIFQTPFGRSSRRPS